MGHLYPKNLSKLMFNLSVVNDGITGNEVISEAIERGELVRCAEGAYEDLRMYESAILDLLFYYDKLGYIEWEGEVKPENKDQRLSTQFRFVVEMKWREGAVYCSRHIEHIEH